MCSLEIEKVLVLSTAHLSEEDANRLQKEGDRLPWVTMQSEYGWLIRQPIFDEEKAEIEKTPTVVACLTLAKSADCSHVRFDRDGGEVEGLETYDW